MNRVKRTARMYVAQRQAIDVERHVYRRRRETNRAAGRRAEAATRAKEQATP